MTKKEKALFDAAIERAETLAALRWTDIVERDVPAPRSSEATSGWDFNANTCTVNEMWSESVAHGSGKKRNGWHGGASQGGRALFSTEALALMAMRYEVEMASAKKLRQIDLEIRAAKSGIDAA